MKIKNKEKHTILTNPFSDISKPIMLPINMAYGTRVHTTRRCLRRRRLPKTPDSGEPRCWVERGFATAALRINEQKTHYSSCFCCWRIVAVELKRYWTAKRKWWRVAWAVAEGGAERNSRSHIGGNGGERCIVAKISKFKFGIFIKRHFVEWQFNQKIEKFSNLIQYGKCLLYKSKFYI